MRILAQESFRLLSWERIISCLSLLQFFSTCSPFPTVMLSFTSPSPFISKMSWNNIIKISVLSVRSFSIWSMRNFNKNIRLASTITIKNLIWVAWLCFLTWTSPSLFSRVSLFPLVLLSELRRSCTPLSHPQVLCSVSSKFCCSCRLSWHMRSLSLAALRSAWCCSCSCADARSSAPLPWPLSLRAWASWHRPSNESLQHKRLENYSFFNLLQLLTYYMKTLFNTLSECYKIIYMYESKRK